MRMRMTIQNRLVQSARLISNSSFRLTKELLLRGVKLVPSPSGDVINPGGAGQFKGGRVAQLLPCG